MYIIIKKITCFYTPDTRIGAFTENGQSYQAFTAKLLDKYPIKRPTNTYSLAKLIYAPFLFE